MDGLGKKTEEEKLIEQYDKLVKEAHRLSHSDRKASDAKQAEAEEEWQGRSLAQSTAILSLLYIVWEPMRFGTHFVGLDSASAAFLCLRQIDCFSSGQVMTSLHVLEQQAL